MASVCGLTKSYNGIAVIENMSMTIEEGKRTVISGKSGCGKTTFLRILAGLEKPDEGIIKGLPSDGVAYCFQEHRLLPWRSIADNIRLVMPHNSGKEEIVSILREVGLQQSADKLPSQLSGGMLQRAALARAFACGRNWILLDEPTKELDENLKREMINLIERKTQGKTAVIVTHEPGEFMKITDINYNFDDNRQYHM